MKKLISILLVVVIATFTFTMPAFAEEVDTTFVPFDVPYNERLFIDGMTFDMYRSGGFGMFWHKGIMYIEGAGDMLDFDDDSFNTRCYQGVAKSNDDEAVKLSQGTTYIGNKTFYLYKETTDFYIPKSVLRVGTNAFPKNCKATIHGHKGSYIIDYAIENGIKAVIDDEDYEAQYGDMNLDENIDMADVLLLRKYIAKHSGIGLLINSLDCNADTKINMADVLLLRKYLAKWDVSLGTQK